MSNKVHFLLYGLGIYMTICGIYIELGAIVN